jgi:hypothetical protein
MIKSPETLLLRIRTETLRLNLNRAHANFRDLPSLVKQFEGLQSRLGSIRDDALSLSDKVSKLRTEVVRKDMEEQQDVIEVHNRVDGIVEALASALKDLKALGAKSFLECLRRSDSSSAGVAQGGSVGQSIWDFFKRPRPRFEGCRQGDREQSFRSNRVGDARQD